MDNLPVFIVGDDPDDRSTVEDIWKELNMKNELRFLSSGEQLLNELKSDLLPFIIISNVNLPKMDGFTLRQKLMEDESISSKSIPFVCWSEKASKDQIQKAYDLSVHGFFIKEANFEEMKNTFKAIIEYWQLSKAPERL